MRIVEHALEVNVFNPRSQNPLGGTSLNHRMFTEENNLLTYELNPYTIKES